MDKCACFTGYRTSKMPFSPDDEKSVSMIKKAIERSMKVCNKSNVTKYYTGMCDGGDFWAAQTVLKMRDEYKCKLCCVVPFEGHREQIPARYRDEYDEILKAADEVVVLRGPVTDEERAEAYKARNRYMVDNSCALVAVCDAYATRIGGTLHTINYAKKKDLTVMYADVNRFVLLREKAENAPKE